jgi:hypothetical protein
MLHNILNQIKVGSVLIVADQIRRMLVTSAKMYNHHIEIPKSRPGIIIKPFVVKARNSTVFGMFQ